MASRAVATRHGTELVEVDRYWLWLRRLSAHQGFASRYIADLDKYLYVHACGPFLAPLLSCPDSSAALPVAIGQPVISPRERRVARTRLLISATR